MAIEGIRIEDLPPTLRRIAEVAGVPAAVRLAEEYGGTRKYFPLNPAEGHELAEVLGLEAAVALAEHFGLEEVDVPRATAALRRLRDEEIQHRLACGDSTNTVARAFGVSWRHVYRIKARQPADDRQENLI
jgi:Mor family transcriptional regulator